MARPKSENSRKHQYRLRLSDVEMKMLKDLETKYKQPKSFILRYLITSEWLKIKEEE